MSFILLGILNSAASGVSGGPTYLAILAGTTNSNSDQNNNGAIALDSSDNIILGSSYYSGSYKAQLYKLDRAANSISWQRIFALNNRYNCIPGVGSGDYVYAILGATSAYGAVKLSPSGSVIWLNYQGSAPTANYGKYKSNVMWAIGRYQPGSYNYPVVSGWDVNGNQQNFATPKNAGINPGVNTSANDASWDSADSIFLPVTYNSNQVVFAKRTATGNTWTNARLVQFVSSAYAYALEHDALDNFYMATLHYTSPTTAHLAKWNTTPTLLWQRSISSSSGPVTVGKMAFDADGNGYLCGQLDVTKAYVIKFDTNGNVLWQRSIENAATIKPVNITIDSQGTPILGGRTNVTGDYQPFIASLPSDGSFTGTVSLGGYSHTIAASSMTIAAATFTESSTSMGSDNPYYGYSPSSNTSSSNDNRTITKVAL